MEFSIEAIFIGLDFVFKSPQFKLLSDYPILLGNFHKHIAGRYPFSTSDISGSGKSGYSNLVAGISLFRGNGQLDVYLDKFSASFVNLVNQNDIDTALDCMTLAEKSLYDIISNEEFLEYNIRPIIHYRSKDDNDSVKDFLTDNFRPQRKYTFISSDKSMAVNNGAKFEFESIVEKWRIGIDLYRSTFDDSVMILNCNSCYLPDGKFNTTTERGNHLSELIGMFLNQVGIKIDQY